MFSFCLPKRIVRVLFGLVLFTFGMASRMPQVTAFAGKNRHAQTPFNLEGPVRAMAKARTGWVRSFPEVSKRILRRSMSGQRTAMEGGAGFEPTALAPVRTPHIRMCFPPVSAPHCTAMPGRYKVDPGERNRTALLVSKRPRLKAAFTPNSPSPKEGE